MSSENSPNAENQDGDKSNEAHEVDIATTSCDTFLRPLMCSEDEMGPETNLTVHLQDCESPEVLREQDRFLPIANIARIMKRVIPETGKVSKEAKECCQECVSEFISFITSEASDRCSSEKRKTINGEDILWALQTLGFDPYVEPLKVFLAKSREACKGTPSGTVLQTHGDLQKFIADKQPIASQDVAIANSSGANNMVTLVVQQLKQNPEDGTVLVQFQDASGNSTVMPVKGYPSLSGLAGRSGQQILQLSTPLEGDKTSLVTPTSNS